jgi:hypothetical protein
LTYSGHSTIYPKDGRARIAKSTGLGYRQWMGGIIVDEPGAAQLIGDSTAQNGFLVQDCHRAATTTGNGWPA